jgi:RNA polymerase sigma-70 factor, ECF subfamily
VPYPLLGVAGISPGFGSMSDTSFANFYSRYKAPIEAMHRDSHADRWSVTVWEFAAAIWEAIKPAWEESPSEVAGLLERLRVEDLALALGCVKGDEGAWDSFCARYRSTLFDAALSFTGEESKARELADDLLAELYGLESASATRRSKLAQFHGRSSLKTWLHSIIHHEFVNEYRRQAHLAPLPEEGADPPAEARAVSEPEEAKLAKCLGEAIEAVLDGLPAAEKLLLAYYYLQGLTMKQIGRLTGEHESTVFRHLEALTRKLRRRIEGQLKRVGHLTSYEIERCLDFAARGAELNLEKVLKPR